MSTVGRFLRKNVRSATGRLLQLAPTGDDTVGLRGHIDRVELARGFTRASGWSLLPEPREGAAVWLVLHGRTVGRVAQQFERPDLAAAGLGPRARGFSVRLTRVLSASEAAQVRLALGPGESVVEQAPPLVTDFPPAVGAIDRLEGGHVAGWVFVDAPPSAGAVHLFIDDVDVGPVHCDVERPDVQDTGLPALTTGFSKDLLDVPTNERRDEVMACFDGGEHRVSLRHRSHEIVGVDLRLALEFDGRLDGVRGGWVHGWAVVRGWPTRRVKLDILCDDDVALTVTADQHRGDIARAKLSDGRSGFSVRLPVSPSGASPVRLSVRVSGTTQVLRAKSDDPVDLPRTFQTGSVLAALQRAEHASPRVTVVVPIYNAASALAACLAAVQRHTRAPFRLVLIDDASPDPEVGRILAEYEPLEHVVVVRNPSNRGFTRNINAGLALAERDDVVMLNSDTEVTPRWLHNLRLAAYSGERVGTATALSNAAGAFSVPVSGQVNDLPAWLDLDAHGRLVTQSSAALYPRTPTGNGFCMYLRRDMLDAVGTLDEAAFPRGYGEENDLCMRALRLGFEHVVDDRTFVYHVRSASFGEHKHELMSAGRAVVDERYPEYAKLVSDFRRGEDMALVRHRVRGALARSHHPRPRVLFVTSTQTGGTPQTNQDLMGALDDRYEPLLMRCDAAKLYLYSVAGAEVKLLEEAPLARPVQLTSHTSDDYDEVVARWLVHYAIELVHIRHIAWHSVTLTSVVKRLGLGLVFSLHDFYTVCPSVKLLDQDLRPCGGKCTPGIGERDCNIELWPARNAPPLKHRWIHAWRAKMERMLAQADCLVTTSEGARALVRDSFPGLLEKPFHVIEHGRDFNAFEHLAADLGEASRIRILLPGNISVAKGAALVAELVALDRSQLFEFHVLGDADHSLTDLPIVRHGKYKRHEFSARVAAIRPHFGAVLSIWGETYCHTLTELWAAGVPVIAVDMGAVGERIREHGGGWLLPAGSAEDVYRELVRLARDVDGHLQRVHEIGLWQRGHGRDHGTRSMARRYADLYASLLTAGRHATTPCVAVVTPGGIGPSATTAEHARVRERVRASATRSVEYQLVHWSALVTSQAKRFSAVLVQGTAVPAEHVHAFVRASEDAQLPIIFELDDDLLDVALDADRHLGARSAAQVTALAELARAAALVTVPASPLAERLRAFNRNVAVVPHTLSERLWFEPLTDSVATAPVQPLEADELRLFCVGDAMQDEELALLERALTLVRQDVPSARLFFVGSAAVPGWCDHVAVPGDAQDYPTFVRWARTVGGSTHVALAPWVATPTNRFKSPVEHLHYAALGLPAVFSDVAPYRDVVRDGQTGVLVRNTPEAWAGAIVQLFRDGAMRLQLAEQARAEAIASHRLGPTLASWDTLVRSVLPEL